jgi:hypothetical protein
MRLGLFRDPIASPEVYKKCTDQHWFIKLSVLYNVNVLRHKFIVPSVSLRETPSITKNIVDPLTPSSLTTRPEYDPR